MRYRIEDSLAATKAAIDEGIVVGGGVALMRCLEEVINTEINTDVPVGITMNIGFKILQQALIKPLKQIAENAGKDGSEIMSVIKNQETNYGYNAQTDICEDLVKGGVIDPTKVVRCALQNAVSAAMMFLLTEVIIIDIPENNQKVL